MNCCSAAVEIELSGLEVEVQIGTTWTKVDSVKLRSKDLTTKIELVGPDNAEAKLMFDKPDPQGTTWKIFARKSLLKTP